MSESHDTLVIALGGNAISAPDEEGTIHDQFAHTAQTADILSSLVERGHPLIITHGNGPQVGNVLRRVELASDQMYPLPLEVCVADTQAGMGYMIAQCMTNALAKRKLKRDVTAIVTTVLVCRDDPAFDNPTKPIGSRLSEAEAELHRANDGWEIQQTSGGFYQRMVPSPVPRQIVELPAIRNLVDSGQIVVACGGGGIPVIRDEQGAYHGRAAVVDKDRTSALLALELGVPTLVMLTSVEQVCLHFGKPDEKPLDRLTTEEAQKYLAEGQFAVGSMGPKIEAAVDFVTKSHHAHAVAIITHLDRLADALEGHGGTRIVASP